MQVLLDQGAPAPLRHDVKSHRVVTVFEKGGSRMQNGDLLDMAEPARFDGLVTTDQNLKYPQVAGAIDGMKPGDCVEIVF